MKPRGVSVALRGRLKTIGFARPRGWLIQLGSFQQPAEPAVEAANKLMLVVLGIVIARSAVRAIARYWQAARARHPRRFSRLVMRRAARGNEHHARGQQQTVTKLSASDQRFNRPHVASSDGY